MNFYVVKGKDDKIYEGNIVKVVDENRNAEFSVDIKNYYIYDFERSLWEKWPNQDNHIATYLSKRKYANQISSYPSLEIAKKKCESNFR